MGEVLHTPTSRVESGCPNAYIKAFSALSKIAQVFSLAGSLRLAEVSCIYSQVLREEEMEPSLCDYLRVQKDLETRLQAANGANTA